MTQAKEKEVEVTLYRGTMFYKGKAIEVGTKFKCSERFAELNKTKLLTKQDLVAQKEAEKKEAK